MWFPGNSHGDEAAVLRLCADFFTRLHRACPATEECCAVMVRFEEASAAASGWPSEHPNAYTQHISQRRFVFLPQLKGIIDAALDSLAPALAPPPPPPQLQQRAAPSQPPARPPPPPQLMQLPAPFLVSLAVYQETVSEILDQAGYCVPITAAELRHVAHAFAVARSPVAAAAPPSQSLCKARRKLLVRTCDRLLLAAMNRVRLAPLDAGEAKGNLRATVSLIIALHSVCPLTESDRWRFAAATDAAAGWFEDHPNADKEPS